MAFSNYFLPKVMAYTAKAMQIDSAEGNEGDANQGMVQEDYVVLTGAAAIRNVLRPRPAPQQPQRNQFRKRGGSAPPTASRSRRTEQPPRRIGHLLNATPSFDAQYDLQHDHPTLVTEYSRAYCPPRIHAQFRRSTERVGMKTEAWSRADGCIYLSSPMMCRDGYLEMIT
eukprot:CAMPEP_0119333872 /NCGR_PEP_ID=MMETSP1333-20130426/86165_1 /TAXON_ID=418940 /ORGANISM="Scyphosphaera apsteinii, Strain RCC1455" /LENGTH=169 /DNA_ID=CAMNT_0007344043 /DNA_START=105 /DNA_END=615 /DNA_ORIENTATION=+